ncbi:MAG TPA: hypothetical protein VLL52_04385, partial [Anaerolineae bacterium]|nr:hypothetical protein [Anaerolineae bacterium]
LQRYREEIGGQVYMELAYWQINLRDLAGDAYAARLEPVAAALSAVMPMVDPVAARLASWRTIVGSQGLTEKEKSFLIYFTDVYRPLAALESIGEDVMSELNLMQEPYVFDPYEIGLRQGLEQGLERGEVNGLRRAVGQVLVERFGEVDEVWWERLAGINDEGLLLGLLRDVWRAEGVADLVWEAEGE